MVVYVLWWQKYDDVENYEYEGFSIEEFDLDDFVS